MNRTVAVTITHLELSSPEALRPSTLVATGVVLRRELEPDAPLVAAAMYSRVGAAWHWRDRLAWTPHDWASYVQRGGVELWTLTEGHASIGYFELERDGGVVTLRLFGLAAEGMGRGLGGWLLTKACERAWELGASRVVLNTCTLDGPAAMSNYLARGFRVVRVEHQDREVPA